MPRQKMSEKERKANKAVYSKKWRNNNPEKARDISLRWRGNNPEKVRDMSRKGCAKFRNTDKGKVSRALDTLVIMLRRQHRMAEIRKEIGQHKCIVCGKSKSSALDFHHRKGVIKCFDISSVIMCTRKYPWEVLVAEARKCDVICSEHHREIEHALSAEKLLVVAGVTMKDVEAKARKFGHLKPLARTVVGATPVEGDNARSG